jgi:hypothetical protein
MTTNRDNDPDRLFRPRETWGLLLLAAFGWLAVVGLGTVLRVIARALGV